MKDVIFSLQTQPLALECRLPRALMLAKLTAMDPNTSAIGFVQKMNPKEALLLVQAIIAHPDVQSYLQANAPLVEHGRHFGKELSN